MLTQAFSGSGASAAEELVEFRYTVAPESTSSLSYCPLDPSRLATGTSIDIDWGDGSTETLSAGSSTTVPKHSYATSDGTCYQITLKADGGTWAGVTAMFFGTSTTVSLSMLDAVPDEEDEPEVVDVEAEDDEPKPKVLATKTTPADQTSARVRYLVSVDSKLPVLGTTTRAYMFYNNRLLESIPNDIFAAQAPGITSFYYTFYYCLSLKCPSNELFKNCSSATNFGRCFGYCENLDSEENFPEGFFADCNAMEDAGACFQCAWLGNITSPIFGQVDEDGTLDSLLPNLTIVSNSGGGCFYKATLGDISAPIFSNLPALVNVSADGGTYGCFRGATLGDISAPIFSNLPALVNVSGNGSNYGCFYVATLGDISSPIFSDLPSLTSVGSSSYGCFHYATFSKGTIRSNLFHNCPLVASLYGMFNSNSSYASLTSVASNIFANLPALTEVANAFYYQNKLTATIDLTGSDNISSGSYFGQNSGGITVKVNKGSTTDSAMSASNAYCTVTY